MKDRIYALQIKPSDMELVRFLYDLPLPEIKRPYKTWLVIEVAENGESITTEVISERAMWNRYDLRKQNPFLVRLSKVKED